MALPGLSEGEAALRLAKRGPNVLAEARPPSWWHLVWAQLKSPLVLLLLGACTISALLSELTDALAIAAIVVLNGAFGVIQEARAEQAIRALHSLTGPRARVRRDGRAQVIAAREVVVGDLLVLEAGDIVPADAKLIEANRLGTNEAPLTGESEQVEKSVARNDRVFMGTAVVAGTGVAEVFATGMHTELGKIAGMLAQTQQPPTPMQLRLTALSRVLLVACLVIVGIVAGVSLVRGARGFDVFLSAVSLAVAAVPEGLPAIVTLALALGVRRLASRHVLVRHLSAVETLGCASVICTDKTGTLTTGVMSVCDHWGPDLRELLYTGAACCDAELVANGKPGVGDTTELAILMAAQSAGIRREDIEHRHPRLSERPFDSDRKRMSVARNDGTVYVKGAAESVLALCTGNTTAAQHASQDMAERGLRVLAFAVGQGEREENLRLVGLLGLADPPREGAARAIAEARAAGIETVLITGDHPLTAHSVAKALGIEGARVHARATPETKLRIVQDLRATGAVVAMTGDGVNDAPALHAANVGICMGQTGTEVARQASDLILTDDNLATIVSGVREGRAIFENIRKALVYLLSGNAAELLAMLGAALLGLPPPLLPLHLLWVNLVTDGLPALGLVMGPAEADIMSHPPRDTRESILRRHDWVRIAGVGALEATVCLLVFAWALRNRDEREARTLAFSTIMVSELFRSLASQSNTRTFLQLRFFGNRTLLAIVLLSLVAQLGLHVLAPAQAIFQLAPFRFEALLIALGAGLIPVSAVELIKLASARGAPPPVPTQEVHAKH